MSKSLIKIVFHLDLPAPTLVKGSDLTKAVCNRRVIISFLLSVHSWKNIREEGRLIICNHSLVKNQFL